MGGDTKKAVMAHEVTLDAKSKVFFTLLFLLLVVSVSATFYKYIILKDYVVIESAVDADAE